MPAGTVTEANLNALQAQINALGERMEAGFKRLEERIEAFDQRVRSVENLEAGCQPLINARLAALENKAERNAAEIKALKDVVAELQHTNRILIWLGSLVGSSIILWIIGQMLGLVK